ncbi:MAG: glucosaminidase domain-containing protein, partial [Kordiimonadaceae bacterium]|nr:glucosaminidase domain-containing protein [Kordiimonadaceae bacterium]
MIYILLFALLAIVPLGIARHMLSLSRGDAYLADQPNYLAHQYPPRGEAELTERLASILDKKMHVIDRVPRVYLSRLPEVLPEIHHAPKKKRLFTSTMLPIILRANELIIADRGRLIALRKKLLGQQPLKRVEREWLYTTARSYKEKLPKTLKADDINILLFKIDVIPPSLALAQAAIETGWGTSKFAQQGNALFGEWVWDKNAAGIVPSGREEGKTHRIKSFEYLLDSVRSYMVNLNRHHSYTDLRHRRAELRQHSLIVTGAALAPALSSYSQRGTDYVNDVLSII